ncbi:MAG: hypothetical protein ACOC3V_02650 [bacterium]
MIIIDKNIGNWIPIEQHSMFNIEYIDDVAYHIYCQYRKERQIQNITPQMNVLVHKKLYRRFYDEARLLIRLEKILKLKEKLC